MPRSRPGHLLAGLIAALTLSACSTLAPVTAPVTATAPPDAAALLNQLVVAEEDTGAHYKREQWGEDWARAAGGCDTRDLVLIAQARGAHQGEGCAVRCPDPATPCWTSPYDGHTTADPGELEVDHRVSLKEASRSRVVNAGEPGLGAARVWRPAQKQAFYEDRGNLVATTSEVNQAKSHHDAGDWKPPLRSAWCEFATGYVQTKITWKLSVDAAERDGLAEMLATCPAG